MDISISYYPPSMTERSMFYIYILQNMINKKIYIGASNNPKKRFCKHFTIAKNTSLYKKKKQYYYIHNSINKYGKNNFAYYVIENFHTWKETVEAEQFWISFFRSWDNEYGYNLTKGGEGTYGKKLSKSHKEKISISLLGNKRAQGTKHDYNWKKEMSVKHTGERNGRARLCKQDILFIRKFHTDNIDSNLDVFKHLSDKYGLSISGLEKIIYRKTWKHI